VKAIRSTSGLGAFQLAQRGLGANGEWIGIDAAATHWQALETSPATNGPDGATLDAGMAVVAQVHLCIEALTERRMDALRAAFLLGRAIKYPDSPTLNK